MESRSDTRISDTVAAEIGTIAFEGKEFSCGGFWIDMPRGRMVAYVSRKDGGYVLTTWHGEFVARLMRTDRHAASYIRDSAMRRRIGAGPHGFYGVELQSFRTLDPIAGYHWYGRGRGEGMILRLRRGRKAGR